MTSKHRHIAQLKRSLVDCNEALTNLNDALPHINDPKIREPLNNALELAQTGIGSALDGGINREVADILANIRSALLRHTIPSIDADLGAPTESLKRASEAAGLLLYRIDPALNAAKDLGLLPSNIENLPASTSTVPRALHEESLSAIAAQLIDIQLKVDAVSALNQDANYTQQQYSLINIFVSKMNVQLDFARFEAIIEEIVDLRALGRAIAALGSTTRKFSYSVANMITHISASVREAAEKVRISVGSVLGKTSLFFKRLTPPKKDEAPTPPPVKPEEFDIDTVREMVLAGEKVPQSWVPFIDQLNFDHSSLISIEAIAEFLNLTRVDLDGTQITDLAPLEKLTNLSALHLDYTQITDLAPLEKLTNLSALYLDNTQITDLAPLENLANLSTLYLNNTQITDLAPLEKLTNLSELWLQKTEIRDNDPVLKILKNREVAIFR